VRAGRPDFDTVEVTEAEEDSSSNYDGVTTDRESRGHGGLL